MQNQSIILVGAGEYYRNFAVPSLQALQDAGLVGEIKLVDTRAGEGIHYVRAEGQPLSEIVKASGLEDPVVILAHANHLHTPDAIEILTKNNTPKETRVLIEKPYAIDTRQFRKLEPLFVEQSPRIGVLEYYLTMKAVPLLVFA